MGVREPSLSLYRVLPNNEKGQMTVEMAVAFPVLVIVAVIAVNACTFFYECAIFDRVFPEAVRVYATSPAYGQGADQAASAVEQVISDQLDETNLSVSIGHASEGLGLERFKAVLEYQPTLFGMGLRSEVFGVSLPSLKHEISYVVDPYKPGVVV